MNSETQISLRDRCRQLKKKGFTIQQIADKLDIPYSTIGYYVKGISKRSPRHIAVDSIIRQTGIRQRKGA
ncbi:unnamed protein product, partial [marine sediment metagenome]